MIGIHETIVGEFDREFAKIPILGFIEGPNQPEWGWANYHIQGFGNFSITVTAFQDQFVVGTFSHGLRDRMVSEWFAYANCVGCRYKEMAEPGSFEWVVEYVKDEFQRHSMWPDKTIIANIMRELKHQLPACCYLGRPGYCL